MTRDQRSGVRRCCRCRSGKVAKKIKNFSKSATFFRKVGRQTEKRGKMANQGHFLKRNCYLTPKEFPRRNGKSQKSLSKSVFPNGQSDFRPLKYNFPNGQSDFKPLKCNFPNGQSDFKPLKCNFPNGQSDFRPLKYNFPNGQSGFSSLEYSCPNGQSDFSSLKCNYTKNRALFVEINRK